MRVLVFEPGYSPYTAIFSDSAGAVSKVIRREHEVKMPFDNDVIALVCDAQQDELLPNRSINDDLIIKGRFFVCGHDGNNLCGLTRKQADRYSRRYLYPEQFEHTGDGLIAVPQNPRVKPGDERLGKKGNIMER